MYRVLIGFRRVSILLKNPTEAPSQNPSHSEDISYEACQEALQQLC